MISERAKCNKNATTGTVFFEGKNDLFFKETKGKKEGQKAWCQGWHLTLAPLAPALVPSVAPMFGTFGTKGFRATFYPLFGHWAQVVPRLCPRVPYMAPGTLAPYRASHVRGHQNAWFFGVLIFEGRREAKNGRKERKERSEDSAGNSALPPVAEGLLPQRSERGFRRGCDKERKTCCNRASCRGC